MSTFEIQIPSVGESVTEANIGRFIVKGGEWVEKGDAVLEIETDKASMEVNSPESGLVNYSVSEGDLVTIGSTVGTVDPSAEKPAGNTQSESSDSQAAPASNGASEGSSSATTSSSESSSSAVLAGQNFTEEQLKGLGPAKRKAVREGKLKLGRATASASAGAEENDVEIKPMSVIRKKIAERLLHSQQSTASLTTFNEVDMSQVLSTRSANKDAFLAKFGVKLGFMSYFTKAVAFAHEHVPSVNAQITDDGNIAYNKNVHVSIAVSTDRGLVVPVLRNANKMSFAEIEKGIGDLATKARDGKLGIDDMMGGSFTLTNGGVFGSLVSTPILNPPQSGILGMHKIEHRPMALDDGSGNYSVVVRPMMYLALTYDHRLVDGKESVTFLVKIKEYLENVTTEMVMA